jgi:hypothetical protein
MGDISAEPSMEEILSSIKRIIAEEGEGTPPRARRPQRVAAPSPANDPRPHADADEVLELSEPMPALSGPADRPVAAAEFAGPARPTEAIVSQETAAASRGSLEALTKLVVKPEGASGDNALEAVVRDMLRPMLREWLDARLPEIVEAMVAREIERITGAQR